ncbi:hypothetical protein DERF_002767 [Dermatophagoides farinae]|uniref:Uncharacterized protein n=1 Tax=Dermatophagoides farinae TaxID=6954 RepID=A0A922IDI6_DERFA|nr:hypothetical protein DERF_002767 [Dermatophagoides farinae]
MKEKNCKATETTEILLQNLIILYFLYIFSTCLIPFHLSTSIPCRIQILSFKFSVNHDSTD